MSAEKIDRFANFASNGRVSHDASSEDFSASPMNPKLEIALRKEKQLLQEEAQYTYKPTLNKSKKGAEKDKPDENRFDRLYSDALKRHLESKWKESVGDKDLTFKPKISTKGSNSRSSSRERGSVSDSVASRLFSPKVKSVEVEEYSFTPTITKRARSIDRSQHRETAERLYLHSKVAKEKQDKIKQDFDQKTMEDCTFAPKTNSVPRNTPQKMDLTERMDKYEEFKNRRREEALRIKNEQENEGVTFKPAIKLTKRSSTPTKTSVYERLAALADRDREVSASHAEMEAQLTFKPQLISKRSASPSPRAANGTEYKDVHERLFKEGLQRRKDLEVERQLLQEENESHLTFTPVINPRSAVKDKSGASEKENGPVFERLSTTTSRQYMQEVLSKIKTDLEMKDCTFKPKLLTEARSTTKEGAASDPIHVRLAQEGERIKAETQRKQEQKMSEELSQATFSPQIPVRSTSIAKRRTSTLSASLDSDSVVDDSIFNRLYTTKTVSVDPSIPVTGTLSEAEIKPKVVLPKQEVERIFRRLSVAPTESSLMRDDTRDDVSVSTSTNALVLPSADVDKIFSNLSMKRTTSFAMRMQAQQEEISGTPVKSPIKGIKTLPEESLEKVFRRLSSMDLNETLRREQAMLAANGGAAPPIGSPNDGSSGGRRGSVRPENSPLSRSFSAKFGSPPSANRSSSQLTTVFEAEINTPPPAVAPLTQPVVQPPQPPPPPAATVTQKPQIQQVVQPPQPPPPAVVNQTAAPSTNNSKPTTVPAKATTVPSGTGAAGSGDFFSKLEASLSLMESSIAASKQPRTAVPPAQTAAPVVPPPQIATTQLASLQEEDEGEDDEGSVGTKPTQHAEVEKAVVHAPTQQVTQPSTTSAVPRVNSMKKPTTTQNGTSTTTTPARNGKPSAIPQKSPVGGARKPVTTQNNTNANTPNANGAKVVKGNKKPNDEKARGVKKTISDDAALFIENIPYAATEGSDSD